MLVFSNLRVIWKIIIPYILLVLLTTGFMQLWYVVSEIKRLETQQLQKMEIIIQGLASAGSNPLAIREYDRLQELLVGMQAIDSDISYVFLSNNQGENLVGNGVLPWGESQNLQTPLTEKKLPSGVTLVEYAGNGADYELRFPVTLFDIVMGELRIGVSKARIQAESRSFVAINLLIGLLTAMVGIFVFNWIVRVGVNKPIQELNRASEKISAGDLETRALYSSEDELGNLAKAFNSMTGQLGQTLEGLERQIVERIRAEEETRILNAELEQRVGERTAELEKAYLELEHRAGELDKARVTAEDATRTKSDFLARMSHEIRTPMNAIIGLTNLVLKTDLSSTQKDQLLKVYESSRHLLSIINDILDFSKIEAGKLELEEVDFMLQHVIEKMTNMFRVRAAEKQIELFYIISKNVPLALKGDALRVGQILINLISNAVKFTDRGEIIIKVEPNSENQASEPEMVRLLFSVRDSGIGLEQDKLPTLFEPFTQTDSSVTRKYGGTGLGLSICQRLVALMGGKIWVTSDPGSGAVFYFSLLLKRQISADAHTMQTPADITGMKVLVVDDNETARLVLEEMLESFGLRTTVASGGREALIELEKEAGKAPYQLVLVDWKMPEMDGFQLAGHISHHPVLGSETILPKIIMVTMYGREELICRQKRQETGISGYLLKPVSSSELFNCIMEVFGKDEAMVSRIAREPENVELVDIEGIKGARLLLVEDNEINQQVARLILERVGFIVETVENGLEAVNLLKSRVGTTKPFFDAVLMDIEMPIMDGYSATSGIRAESRFADLPIIAMTAHALKGDREKCLAAGMNDYLAKPIDERELFVALAKWLKPGKIELPEKETPPKNERGESWEDMPAEIPGLDLEAALEIIHGNSDLFRKMLKSFLEQYEQADQEIRNFLDNGNRHEAGALAHTIKGAAGIIGAKDIAGAASDLELALADQEKTSGQRALVEVFAQKLSPLMAALLDLELGEGLEEEPPKEGSVVNKATVDPLLREMGDLLAKSDSRVRHFLPALKKALYQHGFTEQLDLLDRAVYELDSDKAQAVLVGIAKELMLDFSEED